MPEATQIVFTYKEVAEALIKQQSIHEGIWGLYIEFAIQAANVGPDKDSLHPAAIVPIVRIGLQKFPEENNLSVNAALVNPPRLIPDDRPSFNKRRGS
jgi:hypothetical protein